MPKPATPQPEPRTTPRPRFWLIVIGLVTAWCLYLAFFGPKQSHGDLRPPALNPPGPASVKASFDWAVEDLDGQRVDLSAYRGRPFVLNIWATWCPPCQAEFPSIANLATHPRAQGVPIVCVAVNDERTAVAAFTTKRKFPATVLVSRGVPPAVFQTEGIPATFIIDAEGNIVVQEIGAAQWDDPRVVALLESLATNR